jgi:hypothetical protein
MTLGIFIFVAVPLLFVLIMTWFILVSVEKIESDMTAMRDELDRRGWPDWKPGANHKPDDAAYRRDELDDDRSNKARVLEALTRDAPQPVTNQRRMHDTWLSVNEERCGLCGQKL